jgi:hypothetical protein
VATFPQWEYDLLKALGAPASQNNLTALNLWAQSEGSVTNNPLATSGKGVGATTCVAQCGSSSPIYEYDTEAHGVAQMAQFLKGSYYTAIVRAFVQDSGLAAIYQAINASSWCKGCQNGHYPTELFSAANGTSPSTSPTVGTGSATGAGGSGSGSSLSECVIQLPGFLFFSGPCFLTKGGVKWLSGVAALGAGVLLGGFGVVLLASAVGKSTGATSAVGKVAKTVGIGGSLLAGQPEVAAGIEARSALRPKPASSSAAPRGTRTSSGGSGSSSGSGSDLPAAGRLESRRIERRYQDAQRQQGPIGPRGGNPTANRVASRERRGTSVPGARRPNRDSMPF